MVTESSDVRRRWLRQWGWPLCITIGILWGLACNARMAPDGWPTAAHPALWWDIILHTTAIQVTLISVILAGSLLWTSRFIRRQRSSLWRIRQPAPCSLQRLAHGLVPVERLFVLPDTSPYALCIGLWNPAIYVTAGLVEQLPSEELRAVLAHEESHRRRRDPLRHLMLQGVVTRFVRASKAHQLLQWIELRAEIIADRYAREQTSTATMASALFHVLQWHRGHTSVLPASHFDTTILLTERLQDLAQAPSTPLPGRVPPGLSPLMLAFMVIQSSSWVVIPALILAVATTISSWHPAWSVLSCALHI